MTRSPRTHARLWPIPIAALAALATPRSAEACDGPTPCDTTEQWRSFTLWTPVVATDGILMLSGYRPSRELVSDEEAWTYVDVAVTVDGQAIPGSFEFDDGLMIWRPDAPFPPDSALLVSLTVDNEALGENGCDDEPELGPFPVQVTAGPMPAIGEASWSVTSEQMFYEQATIDSLVCCDGAYPAIEDYGCGADLQWTEGSCARTRGRGTVSSQWQLELDPLPPELVGTLLWELIDDSGERIGRLIVRPDSTDQIYDIRSEPFCAHLRLRNQASGEFVEFEERCFAQDWDLIGEVELDPSEALEAACNGEPYVCEIVDEAWDPNACEPYPDQDGQTGDSETGDPDATAAAGEAGCACGVDDERRLAPTLALLALFGALARRRRSAPR